MQRLLNGSSMATSARCWHWRSMLAHARRRHPCRCEARGAREWMLQQSSLAKGQHDDLMSPAHFNASVQQAMRTEVVTKVDRRDRYCLASFETPRPASGERAATLTKMWASCAISGSIWSVGTQWMLLGVGANCLHHFSLAVPLPWRVERGLCRAPSAALRESLPSNHACRDGQRR